MRILRQWKLMGIIGLRLMIGAAAVLLTLAAPASADTDVAYHATFIEPHGGPVNSPFECPPGMSCGTANLGQLGHGSTTETSV